MIDETHLGSSNFFFLLICCRDFYSELWNYFSFIFLLNVNVQSFLDRKETFKKWSEGLNTCNRRNGSEVLSVLFEEQQETLIYEYFGKLLTKTENF